MPDNSSPQLQKAAEYVKNGKFDEAQKIAIGLLRDDRKNERAWWVLANSVSDAGKKRQALKSLLDLKPDYAPAKQMLAKLDQSAPKADTASLPATPEPPQTHETKDVEVKPVDSVSDAPTPDAMLRQAAESLKNGKLDQAHSIATDILEKDPNNEKAWWVLANSVSDQAEKRKALNSLLALKPTFEPAKRMLASLPATPQGKTGKDTEAPPKPIKNETATRQPDSSTKVEKTENRNKPPKSTPKISKRTTGTVAGTVGVKVLTLQPSALTFADLSTWLTPLSETMEAPSTATVPGSRNKPGNRPNEAVMSPDRPRGRFSFSMPPVGALFSQLIKSGKATAFLGYYWPAIVWFIVGLFGTFAIVGSNLLPSATRSFSAIAILGFYLYFPLSIIRHIQLNAFVRFRLNLFTTTEYVGHDYNTNYYRNRPDWLMNGALNLCLTIASVLLLYGPRELFAQVVFLVRALGAWNNGGQKLAIRSAKWGRGWGRR